MSRHRLAGVAVAVALLVPQTLSAQRLERITYAVEIPAPETHLIEVTAVVPTSGRPTIELMMPVWSPGYYRVEDYAANVRDLAARPAPSGVEGTAAGRSLNITPSGKNHWLVDTGGAPTIKLSYRVYCNQRTVTTNYVDADYAVLQGAPTFITLAERSRRRHDVHITLPPGWTHAMSGLDTARLSAGALAKADRRFARPTTKRWWIPRSWPAKLACANFGSMGSRTIS